MPVKSENPAFRPVQFQVCTEIAKKATRRGFDPRSTENGPIWISCGEEEPVNLHIPGALQPLSCTCLLTSIVRKRASRIFALSPDIMMDLTQRTFLNWMGPSRRQRRWKLLQKLSTGKEMIANPMQGPGVNNQSGADLTCDGNPKTYACFRSLTVEFCLAKNMVIMGTWNLHPSV